MNKPHKHAELIKAWADGAIIQERPINKLNNHWDWSDIEEPVWASTFYEYRIKPEPKPDCISHVFTTKGGTLCWAQGQMIGNLKLTFDGETGELKSAEVLK